MNHLKEKFLAALEQEGYAEHGYYSVENLGNQIYHMHEGTKTVPPGTLRNPGDPASMNNPSSVYFAVEGDELLVIDGGNIPAEGSAAEKDAKFILDTFGENKKVSFALTHSHGDHIGLLMNRSVTENLEIKAVYLGREDYADDPESFRFGIETCSPWKDKTILLEDGDSFTVNGSVYETCMIPGHTPGSAVFIQRDRKAVFTGDAAGSGYVWIFWQYGNNPLGMLEDGIRNMLLRTNDLDELHFYAGHRWQQFYALNPEHPGETGRWYAEDMLKVLKGLKDGTAVKHAYPVMKDGVEVYLKGCRAKIDTTELLIREYLAND